MYTFTSADAWKTYDIFVTATDSTNLTDQYELVLTTNTFQHGQSMAAGSPWYGMNESTSTDPQTCGVQFPQWPSPNSAPFLNVQVVITQLPADGTLFIGSARGSREPVRCIANLHLQLGLLPAQYEFLRPGHDSLLFQLPEHRPDYKRTGEPLHQHGEHRGPGGPLGPNRRPGGVQ